MFTIEDLIAKTQTNREEIGSELASVQLVTAKRASELFPNIQLSDSPHIAYFPFKICNSLPTVNKRGRCFTGPVLGRSFASFTDQLVNIEHQINANFPNSRVQDQIAGHIKAVRLGDTVGEVASVNELAYMPDAPLPVIGLGVVYNRAEQGRRVIESHFNRKASWFASMECSHDWKEANFLYRGELIHIQDAPQDMLECVEQGCVKPYKGLELAVALGGKEGKVDFWGAALTQSPADPGANVFSFVSARNRELASHKVFFMPGKFIEMSSSEAANFSADKEIIELANVAVIGETEPHADDGHKHQILSDLTIVPTNGHSHSMRSVSISRGSNPTVSFATHEHYRSVEKDGRYTDHVHMHLGSFSLKGKLKTSGDTGNPADDSPTGSETASSLELLEMKKSLQELSAEVAKLSSQLVAAKDEGERTRISQEIANVNREIASVNQDQVITDKVNEAINAKIKDGSLLTREKANEEITAKEKELADAQKAKEAAEAKINGRIDSIKALGLNPEFELEASGADGKPLTLGGIARNTAIDEAGDSQFNIHLSSWKSMAQSAKEAESAKVTAAAAPAAAAPAAATQQTAEVANTGKKPGMFLTAGAGSTTSTETASTQQQQTAAPATKKFFGKSDALKK